MRLYNTLSRSVEELVVEDKKEETEETKDKEVK